MKNETHETMSAISSAVNKMDELQRERLVGIAEGIVIGKEGLGNAKTNNE